jgi:hypothetical protein
MLLYVVCQALQVMLRQGGRRLLQGRVAACALDAMLLVCL